MASVCNVAALLSGPLPGAPPSAATPQWAPEAPPTRLQRTTHSLADDTLASLLAGTEPDQANWLTAEPSLPTPTQAPAALAPRQAATAAVPSTAAATASDPMLAWMDALGEQGDDAEDWLCAASALSPATASSPAPAPTPVRPPAPEPAPAQQSREDEEVLPLPRLSHEQLRGIRAQQHAAAFQQRPQWHGASLAAAAAATANTAASTPGTGSLPASRRASLQVARASTAGSSRTPSARTAQRQLFGPGGATEPRPAQQLQRQQQQALQAVSRRQSSVSVASTSPPPRRPSTFALSRPASTAASPPKQLWSPNSSMERGRQSMPGTLASSSPMQARRPTGQQSRPATSIPTPSRLTAQGQAGQRRAQPAKPAGQSQLSPVTKVAQWLHSPAYPASRLSAKPRTAGGASASDVLGSQASPHPNSNGNSSWRISVPGSSSAAAVQGTEAGSSTPLKLPPSSFASRIPRPAPAAAAAAATPQAATPSPSHSRPATGLARTHQSELALKQLAQRALAAGSSSPPSLRPVHTRRPSSLLGAHRASSPVEAQSPASSPTKSAAQGPAYQWSAAPAELRLSSAGSCGASTSRSCHRLSTSSSSSPVATQLLQAGSCSSGATTPAASLAALAAPDSPLQAAQAAAASSLAAAQASARQAAADCALLARATPSAWEAAQVVAAAAAPASADLLDLQLQQLDRLALRLSEASSHMSELCLMDALAHSRRASSNHSLASGSPSARERRSRRGDAGSPRRSSHLSSGAASSAAPAAAAAALVSQ